MLKPGNFDNTNIIVPGAQGNDRNGSRAMSNNRMKTLQNDISFDRNFAQTTFKLKDQESNSLETLQHQQKRFNGQLGNSQDLALRKKAERDMKNLLTHYQEESPIAGGGVAGPPKSQMYIMETAGS